MIINGIYMEIFGRKYTDVYNLIWNVYKIKFTDGCIEKEIEGWKEEILY